jgi:signal transduction histidine kinase
LHHGYGLKNMRETAERYGGSLTAHAEDEWFVVRVLLPSPRDHESRGTRRSTARGPKATD